MLSNSDRNKVHFTPYDFHNQTLALIKIKQRNMEKLQNKVAVV